MAPIAFVELLSRDGRVVQRHAVDSLPCLIGRGYDNQAIIDDPFVHPQHARIEQANDGGLAWVDLVRNVTTPIDPVKGLECKAGRTTIRVRTPQFLVETTHLEPFWDTTIGRLVDSPFARTVAVAIGLSCVVTNVYLSTSGRELGEEVGGILVVAFSVLMWSAIWTLVGRLRSSHGTMAMHVAMTSFALLPLTFGDCIVAAAQSIHPALNVGFVLSRLSSTAVLTGLITLQALIIGVPTLRRAAILGSSLATTIVGFTLVMDAVDAGKFSKSLELDTSIFPLPEPVLVTESPQQFLQRAQGLRAELDAELESP